MTVLLGELSMRFLATAEPPSRVLVFAAHQDDETIGCGGTIAKWAESGSYITVVFATDGSTGIDQSGKYSKGIVDSRNNEAARATDILGVSNVINLWNKSQELNNDKKNFRDFISIIRAEQPDIILAHSSQDKHRDHRCVNALAREAAWKASEDIAPELGGKHRTPFVWGFEVLDPHAKCDYVVDTSKTHWIKMKAMKEYESQENIISGITQHLDGLAMIRGHSIDRNFGEGYTNISIYPVSL